MKKQNSKLCYEAPVSAMFGVDTKLAFMSYKAEADGPEGYTVDSESDTFKW